MHFCLDIQLEIFAYCFLVRKIISFSVFKLKLFISVFVWDDAILTYNLNLLSKSAVFLSVLNKCNRVSFSAVKTGPDTTFVDHSICYSVYCCLRDIICVINILKI